MPSIRATGEAEMRFAFLPRVTFRLQRASLQRFRRGSYAGLRTKLVRPNEFIDQLISPTDKHIIMQKFLALALLGMLACSMVVPALGRGYEIPIPRE